MNRIFVRSGFAERHEFRLVSMDDAWIRQFNEQPCAIPTTTAKADGAEELSRKRPRSTDADADTFVAFIMKGKEQLCLHDATSTRTVRRVEYSNVLMLAKRRLNPAGRRAMGERAAATAAVAERGKEASNAAEAPLPLVSVREYHDDVVFASLNRMFDTHAANPQLNVLAVLADSYLTIDELEAAAEMEEENSEDTKSNKNLVLGARHGKSTAAVGFTFAELVRQSHSSPVELAQLLQNVGAVMHHGRVRLLHPCLVYEALDAVLTYLDAADHTEMSWTAVQRHLCPSVYPAVVLQSLQAVYGASGKESDSASLTDEIKKVNSDDNNNMSVVEMAKLLNIPRVLVRLAAGVFDTYAAVTRRTLSTGEVARGLLLEVFLEKWWDSIPSTLFGTAGIPSRHEANAAELFLEKLRGYAVVQPRSGSGGSSSTNHSSSCSSALLQGTLWWMPKEVLTNDFAARLRVLFELRPQRWNQAELEAYMGVLLAPDQSFQHVMVRYAREYRIPGQVVQYAPLT